MSNELDFNSMVRFSAEGDRDTSLQVSVFKGNLSLAVFQGQGGPKVKIPMNNRMAWGIIPYFLNKLRESGQPGAKFELPVTKFDKETKKRPAYATIVFGRDDKNIPYIGIASSTIKPSKFPIRLPLDFDMGQMTVVEQSGLALSALIGVFQHQVPLAVALTSFKREFQGNQGGGNRGGGGYSGGGGNNNSGASAASGPDDEIVF